MFKNLNLKNKILFLIFIFVITIPSIVNGQIPFLEDGEGIKDINKTAGDSGYYTTNSAEDLIKMRMNITVTIVQYVLGFLGIIFLILIIVGGYQWMTAEGNEETIGKAKKRIVNAIIGVTIVLTAYIITSFVFSTLASNTL